MTNLTNGVNLFLVGSNGLDTTIPDLSGMTASQLQDIQNNGTGINRQDAESGVYLSLKSTENIDVYILYGNGSTYGWENTQTIDVTDLDFENGHAIAWRNDETLGTAYKIKFVTTDADAEVRLLPIRKVIITDEIRQDGDLSENFLSWYSNNVEQGVVGGIVQTRNFDGYQRQYHDLSSYSIGDTYSFEVEGYVDHAISFVRMVEEFEPTYDYSDSTLKTTISFVIPAGAFNDYDTTLDVWHTWWSIGDIPPSPFKMTIGIDKTSHDFNRSFALCLQDDNQIYDFSVDWGDGSPIENFKNGDLILWSQAYAPNHQNGISHSAVLGDMPVQFESTLKYVQHSYLNDGDYQIQITGLMPSLAFGIPLEFDLNTWPTSTDDQNVERARTLDWNGIAIGNIPSQEDLMLIKTKALIKSVDQWGDILFTDFSHAFARCYNLQITATDYPKLGADSSLSHMFAYCYGLSDIANSIPSWRTENVKYLDHMFLMAINIDLDLSTKMYQLLDENENLLGEWQAWNTENVEDFSGMFAGGKTSWGRHKFDNDSITNWNVGSSINMSYMFYYSEFNQDLDLAYHAANTNGNENAYESWSWRGSEAYLFLSAMFKNSLFNSSINNWIFPTGSVSAAEMFMDNPVYNQPLKSHRTSLSSGPFSNPMGYYKPFETTYIIHAYSMFENATAFNQDLTTWFPVASNSYVTNNLTPKLTSAYKMFKGATSFNNGDSNANMTWNMPSCTKFDSMFHNATSFNGNVEGFVVSGGTHFNSMFKNATSFSGTNGGYPFGKYNTSTGWDTGNGERFDSMFEGCSSLDISEWHLNMTSGHAAARLFKNCSNLRHLHFTFSNWGNGSTTGFGVTPIFRDPTSARFFLDFLKGCSKLTQSAMEGILAKLNNDLPDLNLYTFTHTPYINGGVSYDGYLETLPVQWRDSEAQSDRDGLVAKGWWVNDNGIDTVIPDEPWLMTFPAWRNPWNEASTAGSVLTSPFGIKTVDYGDGNGSSFINMDNYTVEIHEVVDGDGNVYPNTSFQVDHVLSSASDPNSTSVYGTLYLQVGTHDFYYGYNNSLALIPRLKVTNNATGREQIHSVTIRTIENITPEWGTLNNGLHSVWNILNTRGYGAPDVLSNSSISSTSPSPLLGTSGAGNSNWMHASGGNIPYVTIAEKWFDRYVRGSYSGNTYGDVYVFDLYHSDLHDNGSIGANSNEDLNFEIKKVTRRWGHWKYTGSLWTSNQTHPYEGGYFRKVSLVDSSMASKISSHGNALETDVTAMFRLVDKNVTQHGTRWGDHKYVEYIGPRLKDQVGAGGTWPKKHDNKSSSKWRRAVEYEIEINIKDAASTSGATRNGSLSKSYKVSLVLMDMGVPGV